MVMEKLMIIKKFVRKKLYLLEVVKEFTDIRYGVNWLR